MYSHVSEQPFTGSGGKVKSMAAQEVIIRAHMNNIGYGNKAMIGSTENVFRPTKLDKDFADWLESEKPLPEGCAF